MIDRQQLGDGLSQEFPMDSPTLGATVTYLVSSLMVFGLGSMSLLGQDITPQAVWIAIGALVYALTVAGLDLDGLERWELTVAFIGILGLIGTKFIPQVESAVHSTQMMEMVAWGLAVIAYSLLVFNMGDGRLKPPSKNTAYTVLALTLIAGLTLTAPGPVGMAQAQPASQAQIQEVPDPELGDVENPAWAEDNDTSEYEVNGATDAEKETNLFDKLEKASELTPPSIVLETKGYKAYSWTEARLLTLEAWGNGATETDAKKAGQGFARTYISGQTADLIQSWNKQAEVIEALDNASLTEFSERRELAENETQVIQIDRGGKKTVSVETGQDPIKVEVRVVDTSPATVATASGSCFGFETCNGGCTATVPTNGTYNIQATGNLADTYEVNGQQITDTTQRNLSKGDTVRVSGTENQYGLGYANGGVNLNLNLLQTPNQTVKIDGTQYNLAKRESQVFELPAEKGSQNITVNNTDASNILVTVRVLKGNRPLVFKSPSHSGLYTLQDTRKTGQTLPNGTVKNVTTYQVSKPGSNTTLEINPFNSTEWKATALLSQGSGDTQTLFKTSEWSQHFQQLSNAWSHVRISASDYATSTTSLSRQKVNQTDIVNASQLMKTPAGQLALAGYATNHTADITVRTQEGDTYTGILLASDTRTVSPGASYSSLRSYLKTDTGLVPLDDYVVENVSAPGNGTELTPVTAPGGPAAMLDRVDRMKALKRELGPSQGFIIGGGAIPGIGEGLGGFRSLVPSIPSFDPVRFVSTPVGDFLAQIARLFSL